MDLKSQFQNLIIVFFQTAVSDQEHRHDHNDVNRGTPDACHPVTDHSFLEVMILSAVKTLCLYSQLSPDYKSMPVAQ